LKFGCCDLTGRSVQRGQVDQLLDATVERPALDQLQGTSAAPLKIGCRPVWPVTTGNNVTCTRSTRPAASSARFSDRLPCERNGTSDSRFRRPTTSTASPGSTVASGQSSGACKVVEMTVAGSSRRRVTHGSRTSDSSVLSASIRANCW
jgi:hypothetical protein